MKITAVITIRRAHDEYGGPLIVYAENMVYSSLDYGYTDGDIPALVGFDVLPYDAVETMTPPGNPYEETFDGFLSIEKAWDLFERLGTDAPTNRSFVPAARLESVTGSFDPDSYSFPTSSLTEDVRVEGVVIRSDCQDRRVKLHRPEFTEVNRKQFGQRPSEADSPEAYIVATYCTSARVRKEVRTMVLEEGYDFGLHLNDELHKRVVTDIWSEHWEELMRFNDAFTPAELYPLVAKRCIAELRQMQTNAELNDTEPTDLWQHLS